MLNAGPTVFRDEPGGMGKTSWQTKPGEAQCLMCAGRREGG